MERLLMFVKDGRIGIRLGQEQPVAFFHPDEGAEARRMLDRLALQGRVEDSGILCSSTVDFPEEYGVPQAAMDRFLKEMLRKEEA